MPGTSYLSGGLLHLFTDSVVGTVKEHGARMRAILLIRYFITKRVFVYRMPARPDDVNDTRNRRLFRSVRMSIERTVVGEYCDRFLSPRMLRRRLRHSSKNLEASAHNVLVLRSVVAGLEYPSNQYQGLENKRGKSRKKGVMDLSRLVSCRRLILAVLIQSAIENSTCTGTREHYTSTRLARLCVFGVGREQTALQRSIGQFLRNYNQ